MSPFAPGANPCQHCSSENLVVEGNNLSVMCCDCCATGPSAIGYKEFNGKTRPPEIAVELWNIRDGKLLVPQEVKGDVITTRPN